MPSIKQPDKANQEHAGRVVTLALGAFSILISACTTHIDNGQTVEINQMHGSRIALAEEQTKETSLSHRMFFLGFSIAPPDGRDWIINKKDRTSISLLKKFRSELQTTVIAFAELRHVTAPLNSIDSLVEFVAKTEKLAGADRRFKAYRCDISTVQINESDCAKSDFSTEDWGLPHDKGGAYILEGSTIYCLHPYLNGKGIVVGYSQRYKKGGTPLALDGEIKQFYESLIFEYSDK